MSETGEKPNQESSWRNIRQDVTAQAMSARGRRRRWWSWAKATVLVGLVGFWSWGIYAIVHAWESDKAALASAVRSEPVREIVVVTDGVLTREWVVQVFALSKQASLMTLDLASLREKLMAHGQVRVAVLTRSFPDSLVVTLQERTPVARLQVEDGGGLPRHLLVAKDGLVYDGANYDKTLLASLPWLAGLSLRRSAVGYEPIAGMEVVSDLLTTAQLQAPHLYREWLIVSLARLAEHQELQVKAETISEIVFSAREDFFRQIAQLDYIIEATRSQLGEPVLQSVNLTLGPQVPVKLALTPEELARQQKERKPPLEFNLKPSSSSKSKRDL
ncbi:MAG: FtsQ-type POTRA domain-containing protein [Candidatus Didemnitutus sp.]|nr:FtsQ-type POTRA domain-containing protein [Candidatus Didemnitutus sp.]